MVGMFVKTASSPLQRVCQRGRRIVLPDWLMKKVTSSLKIGVLRSRKSDASSTITGSSVSSSISWRVLGERGRGDRGKGGGREER